jgi:hypothetical protein
VFAKDIINIENKMLQRIHLKLQSHLFDVVWTTGKEPLATDKLSRSQCFSTSDWLEEEKKGAENRCLTVSAANNPRDNPLLNKKFEGAKADTTGSS